MSRKRMAPMTGEEFLLVGRQNGWVQKPTSTNLRTEGLILLREHHGKQEHIKYWPESDAKTVTRYIPSHPKYGGGQMQCHPTRSEMLSMLTEITGPGKGLRTHTSSGYREKKNDPYRRNKS